MNYYTTDLKAKQLHTRVQTKFARATPIKGAFGSPERRKGKAFLIRRSKKQWRFFLQMARARFMFNKKRQAVRRANRLIQSIQRSERRAIRESTT